MIWLCFLSGWAWCTGQVVTVIMRMLIERELGGGLGAKQAGVLGMACDCIRHARATDVAIEANNLVALGHDDMEIMADEEYADAALGANSSNQAVEFCFSGEVDAANWFIQNQ
jgi:hypothetical protein